MTVPAVSPTPRTRPGLGAGAIAGALIEPGHRHHALRENTDGNKEGGESGRFAGSHARGRSSSPLPSINELLDLAASDDFHRWEAQLAATGHCAHPIRLEGRIDAIDKATGQSAAMYDTATEPGGILRIACGNRREDVCPACSQVYKNDARQIIRSGLTGGKGMPETVATHPSVFATLTAPGFGPVHTTRTSRGGRILPCRPRRHAHQPPLPAATLTSPAARPAGPSPAGAPTSLTLGGWDGRCARTPTTPPGPSCSPPPPPTGGPVSPSPSPASSPASPGSPRSNCAPRCG